MFTRLMDAQLARSQDRGDNDLGGSQVSRVLRRADDQRQRQDLGAVGRREQASCASINLVNIQKRAFDRSSVGGFFDSRKTRQYYANVETCLLYTSPSPRD